MQHNTELRLSEGKEPQVGEILDVFRARATYSHEFPGQDYPKELEYRPDEARAILQWSLGTQRMNPKLQTGERVGSPKALITKDIGERTRNQALASAEVGLAKDQQVPVENNRDRIESLVRDRGIKGFGPTYARLVLANLATGVVPDLIGEPKTLTPETHLDFLGYLPASTEETPVTSARPFTSYDTSIPYSRGLHEDIIESLRAAGVNMVSPYEEVNPAHQLP